MPPFRLVIIVVLELSGVSNSVLSKEYVKELFKKHKVLMYEQKVVEQKKGGETYKQIEKELAALRKKLERKEQQLKNKEELLEAKRLYVERLISENEELRKDNKELRGKFQKILEYLYRKGLNEGAFL